MTKAQALRLIRKFEPTTPEDFRDIGLPVTFIGNGVFREVCKIDGQRLIVKFPIADDPEGEDFTSGIKHSRDEMKRIEKLSAFKELRPHLPKVRYYDKENGVIVMDWYEKFVSDDDRVSALGILIRKLLQKLTRVNCSDVHPGNVLCKAYDPTTGKRGDAVLIDLGY